MMLVHHNVWLDDDTPLIKLLYHSKLLEQDLKKAAEKQMAEQSRAQRGGTVRRRR